MPELGSPDQLVVLDDAEPAAWVADALGTWDFTVASLVPSVSQDYGRILHPAVQQQGTGRELVRWATIAEAKGRLVHPLVQFPSLVGTRRFLNGAQGPDCWRYPPAQGTLPAELTGPLTDVLAHHTSTRDLCFLRVWDGFGDSKVSSPTAERVHLPGRELVLLRGPIETVRMSLGTHDFQSANVWWPADRAWFVATDIDFVSTYVGGSIDCTAALVGNPDLEMFRVGPHDGIGYDADHLNPAPVDSP